MSLLHRGLFCVPLFCYLFGYLKKQNKPPLLFAEEINIFVLKISESLKNESELFRFSLDSIL